MNDPNVLPAERDLERLRQAQDYLNKGFYTIEEATEAVQKAFPGYEFNRKQIVRAIEHDNLRCEIVGRTRFIPKAELDDFMLRLHPTANQPKKLRHRRNSRPD